jgi:Spy/CpxP family protein refolding chaperone
MKQTILAAAAAFALAGSAAAYHAVAAPVGAEGPAAQRMAEAGFVLDAKLAGMKAALKLTPEQEKLWPPFETAVRDGVKLRMEAMRDMREQMRGPDRPSPIAMMTEMSDRLGKASEALKKVADTAKPLYDSLDEGQKSHFGPLLRMLREGGQHHGSWAGERGGAGAKPL